MGFHIVNKMQTPMGSWVYTQPETGYTIKSIVWNDLLNKIRDHRIANGIPCLPGWDIQLEDEVCRAMRLTSHWCQSNGKETKPYEPKVSFVDVSNFMRVLTAWMPKREWVDQEEAERRAAICAACPKNIAVSGCSACQNAVAAITKFLGDRVTGVDDQLKGCSVCGCSNRAQVHVPLDVLHKGVTPMMEFPEACWKKLPTPQS